MGVRVVKGEGKGIGDGGWVQREWGCGRGIVRKSREREGEGICANLHGVVFGFRVILYIVLAKEKVVVFLHVALALGHSSAGQVMRCQR